MGRGGGLACGAKGVRDRPVPGIDALQFDDGGFRLGKPDGREDGGPIRFGDPDGGFRSVDGNWLSAGVIFRRYLSLHIDPGVFHRDWSIGLFWPLHGGHNPLFQKVPGFCRGHCGKQQLCRGGIVAFFHQTVSGPRQLEGSLFLDWNDLPLADDSFVLVHAGQVQR